MSCQPPPPLQRWEDTAARAVKAAKKAQIWELMSSEAGRVAVKNQFPQFSPFPGFQKLKTPRRLLRVLHAFLKRHRAAAVTEWPVDILPGDGNTLFIPLPM